MVSVAPWPDAISRTMARPRPLPVPGVPGTTGTGSGLGLAIVREIAAGHGANIVIAEGTGNKGCRVAITFPHG